MGFAAVLVGGSIEATLACVAAFYQRWLDGPIMRLMDMLLSFPAILVGLAIAAIFGPGILSVVIALSVATIPLMARIVRGSALVVMRLDYIEARATGMTDARLILRHLAPNCLSAIFVFVTLRFGQVILLGSALSFLGLGAQPADPGTRRHGLRGAQLPLLRTHIAVIPCVVIFVIVLAFNVLGDALRDALGPRLRF